MEDLLKECAKTGKPVILSTGMANLNEVKNAIKILKEIIVKKLHCFIVFQIIPQTLRIVILNP